MERSIQLTVNRQPLTLEVEDADTLLEVLRDRLQLWSVREACGVGACGSCTVLLDDRPVSSCFLLASRLDGRSIETVEGLGTDQALDPIQEAFLENDAAQCGYCASGIIMTAALFLEENQAPSRSDIQQALAGNLCRCGAHNRIIKAIQRAARELS